MFESEFSSRARSVMVRSIVVLGVLAECLLSLVICS